jgi:nitrite reductase (NADH) large subunit
MACMAKVQGPVTVVPTVDPSAAPEAAIAAATGPGFDLDPEVRRVVVIGNGIAGTTAATEIRKLNPDAHVTLFGHESYDFYNRMAIGKLMSESTAINNLYLLAREWAETKGIEYFPESRIVGVDPAGRSVEVEDGKRLDFDRLVLATGSRAFVPPLEGFGMPGTFVLRTIDDGVQIQQ